MMLITICVYLRAALLSRRYSKRYW